ncbi:hypothetical protein DFP72DRAFT_151594 [Ephemerocybe angulata]|uniref:Uncharacterized protein n=1 Tax=Ephemerocybe angulata TaxID=980116 RepID=A0A8H6I884_9AGAR|nr:hypothetical protein DFP72DRAFT_151594 [Tulosesus angulatus]
MLIKRSLKTRLVGFQLDTAPPSPQSTPSSLKQLDEKMILIEVHLLESRVYRGIGNFPKAKAALTSSPIQAALDLQSGILHAED